MLNDFAGEINYVEYFEAREPSSRSSGPIFVGTDCVSYLCIGRVGAYGKYGDHECFSLVGGASFELVGLACVRTSDSPRRFGLTAASSGRNVEMNQ